VAICERSGAPRWHVLWEGNPVIAHPSELKKIPHTYVTNGTGARPYIVYPFTRQTGWRYHTAWRARDHVGRLYLTDHDMRLGRSLPSPFVVIEPNAKSDTTRNKVWSWDRYAAVVEAYPQIQFVQPLHKDSKPLPGVRTVTASTFREACGVLAASIGYVGTEGAFHHAARALHKLAVVVVGGAINWEVLGYPEHLGIVDDGPDSPCGSWLPCRHCAAALDAITVDRVVLSLKAFLLPREAVA